MCVDEFWNDWQPDLLQYATQSSVSPVIMTAPIAPIVAQSQTSTSTYQKIAAALPPAPVVIPAPVTTAVASAIPTPKASEEVLGVISAYTNAIQNKRKRDENIELDEEAFAQEQKRVRLEIFDPIMEAFNTGDFDQMTKLVRSSCNREVRLKMPNYTTHQGVTPILILWGLLHETYPDAMTKILEKRISSTTSTSCPIQSAEYVYKFHGTRITTKPVLESFAQIMDNIGSKDMTHEEVVTAIARQMTTIPPQAYEENECSFIAETILTFDSDNKITEWAYDILASDVR